jgi:pseudouridine synthase
VGRLDLNSEGLVLLTNDGELANRLTHPRYGHPKEYLVLVEGRPGPGALARLRRGVMLEGRRTRPAGVQRQTVPPAELPTHPVPRAPDTTWLRVTLQEGRKRQIRHMCAAVGHPVLRLVRVSIASLRLGSLKAGEWRDLTAREVRQLRESLGA